MSRLRLFSTVILLALMNGPLHLRAQSSGGMSGMSMPGMDMPGTSMSAPAPATRPPPQLGRLYTCAGSNTRSPTVTTWRVSGRRRRKKQLRYPSWQAAPPI